jgi:NADH-quinone oxidoreductase subunit N
LVLLLRVVGTIGGAHAGIIVGALGVLTATVGNTAAFAQINIKRLLAYSSIAQAGYMMCLVSAAGGAERTAVTQALLLYLIIYAVMNLGAFAVAAVVIRQNGELLENFAGLARSSPLLAGAFFCALVSLIGLPPFAGFGAKVNVLWVLAHGGGFGLFLVLAIVLNTALSAFYYFRVIRVMYLEPANDRSRTGKLWSRDPLGILISSACAAGLVAMFFAFGALYSITSRHPTPAAVTASGGIAPIAVKNS